jgi:hypothetical protein
MSQGTPDPHIRQTNAYYRHLAASGDIAERVVNILQYMENLHINLPIFLWAISWNVEALVSNPQVRFARTTLMLSEELPGILTHWHQPPRQHNAGVRTKAAKLAMTEWALETLCDSIDDELLTLGPYMQFPQEDVSEEALLDIRIQNMILEVQTNAPVLWKLVCNLSCTHKQARRNKNKNNAAMEPVTSPSSLLCFCSPDCFGLSDIAHVNLHTELLSLAF